MTEIWKDIPDYDGFYSASSFGRIRSNKRVVQASNRKMNIREKILRASVGTHGYLVVNLAHKSGKVTNRTVHTIVAETFLGPCPAGQEVLHGDGVRVNCILGNLHYGTRLENVIEAQAHGMHIKGEKVGNSKLKESDVHAIRNCLTAGEGVVMIAQKHGVTHAAIINIRKRRSWAWLEESK